MKQKIILSMVVLFTVLMFLLPPLGISESRKAKKQVIKSSVSPQKKIKPFKAPKKKVTTKELSPLKKKMTAKKEPLPVLKKKELPKKKFWKLSINSIAISWQNHLGSHGKTIYHPANNEPWKQVIPVWGWKYQINKYNPGNTDSIIVYISVSASVQSPPKSQITKADVAKWGAYQSPTFKTKIETGIYNQNSVTGYIIHDGENLIKTGFHRYSPMFTWDDVQQWPEKGKQYILNNVIELKWKKPLSEFGNLGKGATSMQYLVAVKLGNVKNKEFPRFFVFFDSLPIEMIPPDSQSWLVGSTQTIKWIVNRPKAFRKRMRIGLYRGQMSSWTFKRIGTIADNIAPPPPVNNPITMAYKWCVGNLLENQPETDSLQKIADVNDDFSYWIRIEIPGAKMGKGVLPMHYNPNGNSPVLLRFLNPKKYKKSNTKHGAASLKHDVN